MYPAFMVILLGTGDLMYSICILTYKTPLWYTFSHTFFIFILQDQYIFCYQVILYVLRCLQAEENISG